MTNRGKGTRRGWGGFRKQVAPPLFTVCRLRGLVWSGLGSCWVASGSSCKITPVMQDSPKD